MITYSREPQQQIPASNVKIIGLGGAGANMLERIALEGIEGTELLALNTDIRTLGASLAKDKIQLGTNLTKGLGTGGDPELGLQAILEAEHSVRQALKGQRIVFICAGLGGGTGSGAAPIVARIAREEGAFVVAFATMPFFFEGRRRQEQAESSLNQLAVLSNALVTFDNNRMGELVLAKQGIHDAFVAADRMISESIKAVIRLVVRPGIIKIGLDDLMSALRTNRSRCLFGSGIAEGKDRAARALRNALASPLLDQGSLLKDAQTVLVHLCGGESLTLFEIELLMQNLQKYVPENAHVLFGAAIDPSMNDRLSITLISALPEDALKIPSERPAYAPPEDITPEPTPEPTPVSTAEFTYESAPESAPESTPEFIYESTPTPLPESPPIAKIIESPFTIEEEDPLEFEATPLEENNDLFSETESMPAIPSIPTDDIPQQLDVEPVQQTEKTVKSILPPNFNWAKPKTETGTTPTPFPAPATPKPELKLSSKSHSDDQEELSFNSAPKGRFEGESPNVMDGEDLDLPPFLRKKRS